MLKRRKGIAERLKIADNWIRYYEASLPSLGAASRWAPGIVREKVG